MALDANGPLQATASGGARTFCSSRRRAALRDLRGDTVESERAVLIRDAANVQIRRGSVHRV